MTTTISNTPAVSTTPNFFVSTNIHMMNYTSYSGWSGKVYGKGRVSGVSASLAKQLVRIGRITDKAVQLQFVHVASDGTRVYNVNKTAWVPKSKCTFNPDGSFTVNRGFCYFTSGSFPKWQTIQTRSFNPTRTTVI